MARLAPGELLLPDRLLGHPGLAPVFQDWKAALTPLPAARFDSENGRRRLESLYAVAALDGFGVFGRAELAAGGALVDYVALTQKGRLPRLSPPKRLAEGAVMEIDAGTRRNLELALTLSGDKKGSLLSVIDRTVSGPGARLLAQHLAAPLTDVAAIHERLDMVQFFVAHHGLRDSLRAALKQCPDMERALSRLSLGRGGPRDLAAIKEGLGQTPALRQLLRADGLAGPPDGVLAATRHLGEHDALVGHLRAALAETLPLQARDGGFIAAGFHAGLDELRGLRDESRRLVAALQAQYADISGVSALKVRHNNVLGYYIEVPPKQAERMGEPFIHRQTIASGVRYSTVELGDLEQRIVSAADKALALELGLFAELHERTMRDADAIADTARALAALDVAAGLAALAVDQRYCRPDVEEGTAFAITGGRHPVVEAASSEPFVANDCDLGTNNHLWLITGPNMAGKSTFLRQNALIAVLAQMGSFVPADAARIGIVDRPVQSRRRRRRSGPRPLNLHGRNGRNGRHFEPVRPASPGDFGRDRARHGDFRRPFDRLGGRRASARSQSVPGSVRHALSRTDGARRSPARSVVSLHAGQGMAGRRRLPA